MNEAGPRGKGAREGTAGWGGLGESPGGHGVLKLLGRGLKWLLGA